jgi:hypothetical protein
MDRAPGCLGIQRSGARCVPIGDLRTKQLSGCTVCEGLRQVLPTVRQPHERVRLKHAGGLGEGQTAKVVRNGEGGTKRVWKPATRKLVHRTGSTGHPFGDGWTPDALVAVARRTGSRFGLDGRGDDGRWSVRTLGLAGRAGHREPSNPILLGGEGCEARNGRRFLPATVLRIRPPSRRTRRAPSLGTPPDVDVDSAHPPERTFGSRRESELGGDGVRADAFGHPVVPLALAHGCVRASVRARPRTCGGMRHWIIRVHAHHCPLEASARAPFGTRRSAR